MPTTVIFYVDDDPDDIMLFSEAVKKVSGAPILQTYTHGDQLLEAAKQPPLPTIIFLDLNLPGKNGYQILEELKSNPLSDKVPVVIFSTTDARIAIDKCYKLGASLFISKPTKIQQLQKAVTHVLTTDWTKFERSEESFYYIP